MKQIKKAFILIIVFTALFTGIALLTTVDPLYDSLMFMTLKVTVAVSMLSISYTLSMENKFIKDFLEDYE